MHRLHHPTYGDTLLTLSQTEADNAVATYGYVPDGIPFRAAGSGSVPVYTLRNATTRDRLYTASAGEADSAVATYGYTKEGIAFYAATAHAPGLTAVHRLRKGALHRYAMDSERAALEAAGWIYENVIFYAWEGS